MPIEVPCPNCRSVLRAPDEAAGRRVKCRKCEHRFSVPGPEPAFTAEIIEDESQFLSVVKDPAPLPPAPVVQPTAVRPAVVVPAVVVPAPAAPVPAVVVPIAAEPAPIPTAAVDPANPFAFDPNAPTRDDDPDEDDAPRSSRGRVAKTKAAGGAGKVLLIVGILGIVFVVGATAAALGVYYFVAKPAATKASAMAIETVPTPPAETKVEKLVPEPKPIEPAKGKEAGKTKPGGTTSRPPRDKGKGSATPTAAAGVPRATAAAFPIPDPPTGAGKLIAPARDKVTIDVPANQIRAVAFGGKNPRAVAVFWNVFGGFQGAGAKDAIDVYSITTGRQAAHFELPADGITGPRAFGFSPDGNRVVVELPVGKITVFDVDSKEKLLDGIDPFVGAPMPRAGLAGVRFVGSADVIAVVDRAGAVDLWDVKTKARTAGGRPAGAAGGAAPALSDLSSQPLWLFAQGSITEMSAQTADPGVSVTVSDPTGAPLGVAIDSTGRKGAATFRDGGMAHGFAVLDLRPGKYTVTDKLMLPEKAGAPAGVSLLGTGSVAAVQLADRSACLVFDAEHHVPAFYIKAASGPAVKHFGDAEADRLWWVLPDATDGKKSLLVSVDANFDDYQMLVAEAETAKKPLWLTPRADGLAK